MRHPLRAYLVLRWLAKQCGGRDLSKSNYPSFNSSPDKGRLAQKFLKTKSLGNFAKAFPLAFPSGGRCQPSGFSNRKMRFGVRGVVDG